MLVVRGIFAELHGQKLLYAGGGCHLDPPRPKTERQTDTGPTLYALSLSATDAADVQKKLKLPTFALSNYME